MQRSEILLMSMTFLIGCVVGGYMYINGIWVAEQDVAPTAVAWRITGEEEGGCEPRNSCQFVYVDATGTYRLEVGTIERTVETGQLPSAARRDIATLLVATDAQSFQVITNCGDSEASWYRYTIDDGSTTITYLTCDAAVANAPLNQFLAQLWTEARQLQSDSAADYAYEIFHSPESTWLSNFSLIRFIGIEQ